MAKVVVRCAHCQREVLKEVGSVNRANRAGKPLFCSRECSGSRRQLNRSDAEKRALKAAYDRQYREKNAAILRVKKAEYYQRTRDPVREAEKRKAKMPKHVEYCRRPEYKKWKAEYDRQYRARKEFGPFGEASIVLNELIAEINSRSTRTEIYRQNGTLNKWIARRRDYERQTDRR